MARKGAGRKRIQMKKIEDTSKVGVTFSKRRSGLFKKACAVGVLCDCPTAIVIFSPDNKVYSFGDPYADKIFNSFINTIAGQESNVPQLIEGYDYCHLMEEMTKYIGMVEAEKTQEEASTEVEDHCEDDNCLVKFWSAPVEELTLVEAEEMLAKLEDFKPIEDTSGSQAQT